MPDAVAAAPTLSKPSSSNTFLTKPTTEYVLEAACQVSRRSVWSYEGISNSRRLKMLEYCVSRHNQLTDAVSEPGVKVRVYRPFTATLFFGWKGTRLSWTECPPCGQGFGPSAI